jgi:hypothetical protein
MEEGHSSGGQTWVREFRLLGVAVGRDAGPRSCALKNRASAFMKRVSARLLQS